LNTFDDTILRSFVSSPLQAWVDAAISCTSPHDAHAIVTAGATGIICTAAWEYVFVCHGYASHLQHM
jgi:hypothetical protein